MKNKHMIILLLSLLHTGMSFANCVGSGSIKSCYDESSGNSYTVSEIGNSTYVTGSNLNTGHTWSQTSNHIGNTTYTNGTDALGRAWSSTTTHSGNTVIQNGFDANGNPFSNTQVQQPSLNEKSSDSSSVESSLLDDDDDD
jgi:hypothetical protein